MLKARVGIIGDKGRMGAMLKRRLEDAGHEARGADLPLDAADLARACAGAGAVFLCVPAAALEETARKVVPHLPEGCALADITSVKMLPVRAMERAWNGPVVGTHPLFGPKTVAERYPVTVTPGRGWQDGEELPERDAHAVRLVEALFESLGWSPFRCSPKTHDRAMAAIQGLNYITSLAYFAMLSRKPELLPFLTPSFERRKEAARTMLTSDSAMFAGIFAANPMSQEAVREFRSYLNVAAGGDIEVLAELAKKWFPDQAASEGESGLPPTPRRGEA